MHTLGCKVNQTEAESILADMLENGHTQAFDPKDADIVLVSTCAVTNEAERKSRQMARKFATINPNAHLIVCGCASQKNKKQFEGFAKNQTVLGTGGKNKISVCNDFGDLLTLPQTFEEMKIAAPIRTRAYIRIQDGCSLYCTYCIIPFLRGRSRSRSLDNILNEIEIVSKHSSEIVLTGINISDFKIGNEFGLPILLEKLKHLPCRIRLGSLEESVITEDFVKQLSTMPNFCPHFHLCLQSGSSAELKRMNRHYTKEEYFEQIKLIYDYFPDAAITTDLIVGFPEQTDEEFTETKEFIKQCKFYEMHIFKYSQRSGTKAEKMKQVPAEVVKSRIAEITKIAKAMKQTYQASCIGKEYDLLVEEFDGTIAKGKTENYLDAICPVLNAEHGQIIKVKAVAIAKDGVLCEEVKS